MVANGQESNLPDDCERRVVESCEILYAGVMEVLYPLPALSGPESNLESSITVLVSHTVSIEHRRAFLDALKELLLTLEQTHGSNGCKVFEQQEGAVSRVTILQRFSSTEDHEAWLNSESFLRWKEVIAPLNPTLEAVKSYSGIAALFAAGQSPDAPPRWKMAVVLFVAVFPLSLVLSVWFGQALASIPPLTGALITSPIMVLLMTYVLVPLLTKVFSRWLQPSS